MDLKGIDFSFIFDLFNYFHKPDGVTARYCQGMHYWEVGMQGFTVSALKLRISERFNIIARYRNRDWLPSYNWILESKLYGK
jgi:hypothetical protein